MTNVLPPFPLSLLFIFLFFFFTFTSSMAAEYDDSINYPNCPSQKCGDITISYPFWKIGDQTTTKICGYHGFGINCSEFNYSPHDIPTIHLGNDLYIIKIITNRSIVLMDHDLFPAIPGPGDCPRVRHKIDLEGSPFKFSTGNVDLSFHFDCTEIPDFAIPIQCLDRLTKRSCVNGRRNVPDNYNWRCKEEVVTTVIGEHLSDNSPWPELMEALRRGFELNWETVANCINCETSNGRCGYNSSSTEVLCFCDDGTIAVADDCKKVMVPGSGKSWNHKIAVGVISGILGVFIMCIVFYIWRRRHNMKKRYYRSSYTSRNISSYTSSTKDLEKNEGYHGVQIFKYRELEKATNYFDPANELGDGGFGTVYKGKLKDERIIAVKRLYENNYRRVAQFMNEIGILAHLRHPNLVSLYGSTTCHSRELLLVYEYIPNGTVADHLHGQNPSLNPPLPWTTRINIAIETANALVYLHASDVIHRDVKTNNILLDNSFTVKVADFGLSRLFPNNVTHVSTAPQGTPGYVDPEYHECYQLTNKSDVYSFGVVLIELISSKPAVDITRHRHEINLSNMAVNMIKEDRVHELVDPILEYEDDHGVRKMVNGVAELAFQCLQSERDCRPSMEEVLEGLISIRDGRYNQEKQGDVEGTCDDAVLLENRSQNMSPDSVVVAWSSSTNVSISSG